MNGGVGSWSWRLLPLALLLAGWALSVARDVGDAVLPVTVESVRGDWAVARDFLGKPL